MVFKKAYIQLYVSMWEGEKTEFNIIVGRAGVLQVKPLFSHLKYVAMKTFNNIKPVLHLLYFHT